MWHPQCSALRTRVLPALLLIMVAPGVADAQGGYNEFCIQGRRGAWFCTKPGLVCKLIGHGYPGGRCCHRDEFIYRRVGEWFCSRFLTPSPEGVCFLQGFLQGQPGKFIWAPKMDSCQESCQFSHPGALPDTYVCEHWWKLDFTCCKSDRNATVGIVVWTKMETPRACPRMVTGDANNPISPQGVCVRGRSDRFLGLTT
jgi:hypothetical protein